MSPERKSELYFEEIGADFDSFMSQYDVSRRKALIDRLLKRATVSGDAIEVGCGTGAITPVLLGRGLNITVGDISLKLAQETARHFNLIGIECDATRIPLPDQSYGLVISSEVIEHVPDPYAALREMSRITAPAGYLVVTSPNKLWYPLLWLSVKLGVRKFAGNEIWLWPWEAAKVVRESGLEVVQQSGCHLFPWQVPFANKILPLFDLLGDYLWPLMINWGMLAKRPR
jgi:ubiquinone/menaquinone biosynthesis C-methylase UbiE